MKKTILLSALVIAFTSMASVAIEPHSDVFKLDTKQSTLEWAGKKLTGEHKGTIKLSGGQITHNHGSYSGTIEADMSTIENTDLKGDSKAKLENHLRSDGFFDVTVYPKATFVLTSITPFAAPKEDGSTHAVKGNLTIKDKTNEIAFDAIMKMIDQNQLNYTGTLVIDRSKYNVKYGSKTFFPDIGDKIIYDDFTLKFNIVAVK